MHISPHAVHLRDEGHRPTVPLPAGERDRVRGLQDHPEDRNPLTPTLSPSGRGGGPPVLRDGWLTRSKPAKMCACPSACAGTNGYRYLPHTSSATSTIILSFAHCAS